MNISAHITYEEATQSPTATANHISNIPSGEEMERMKAVAEKCFEPAREFWGSPLTVNSFFRCVKLNGAVGGAATSQHVKGEAIDLTTGTRAGNKKLIEWMKANLVFDQLIWEKGDETGPDWIHVSFSLSKNRNMYFPVK